MEEFPRAFLTLHHGLFASYKLVTAATLDITMLCSSLSSHPGGGGRQGRVEFFSQQEEDSHPYS